MSGFPKAFRSFDGPLTRELARTASGAFGQLPAGVAPEAVARTVCGFCSTGCGLSLHVRDGEARNLTPTVDYPVNLGMACPKGWEALRPLEASDRATAPLLRGEDGVRRAVSWKTGLDAFVKGFGDVQRQHGPESVAFLSTGQMPTEEMALLGALAKFGMGMVHGDGNTRQCMATAVTAYKQSFGFDAPPYSYADFEESDLIVLVGSNLAIAHPILWQRVRRNRRGAKVIVIDPRATETAVAADRHYPIRPKSDLSFFYGIANALVHAGAVDQDYVDAHTEGFEEFASHVAPYGAARVEAESGISPEAQAELVEAIATSERVSFWWTMGVNQSYEGTRVAQSLINLALMTGNIGRPGTGANSITGQANAMGSRMFSNTSSLLGGRDFGNAAHRRDVADVLDIDVHRIPSHAGWAYDQIVEGIATGAIRGLWVVATNGAHSWIGQSDFVELLGRLDFLVVQDLYPTTETAALADLVLPAAGWGEKEGTFINSERRVGALKRLRRAPGQALDDFAIFRLVAEAWGCGDLFERWESPAAAFQILRELSAGRPCDLSGIEDYAALDEAGGIQWPWSAEEAANSKGGLPETERRLFADGRFHRENARALFVYGEPRRMPEPPNEARPFLLMTGRGSAAQWHTETRTAKSATLRKLHPRSAYVEIHPDDAEALGILSGAVVEVASERGRLRARAFVTPTIQPGQLFVPMHDPGVNRLTDPVFDPESRQPSYKACAVSVRPLGALEE